MKNKLEREICDRLTVIERRLDNALSKQLEKQEGYLKPLEKTMKSRIEKLGHYEKDGKLFVIEHGEGGTTTLKVEPCKRGNTPYTLFLTIAEKVDEIIDRLNEQLEGIEEVAENLPKWSRVQKELYKAQKEGKRLVFIENPPQDTPRKGEKKFDDWFLERFGEDYENTFFKGDLYDLVKQLLEEKEEETYEKVYKRFCEWEIPQNLSKEQKETFDDLLSKLTKLNNK